MILNYDFVCIFSTTTYSIVSCNVFSIQIWSVPATANVLATGAFAPRRDIPGSSARSASPVVIRFEPWIIYISSKKRWFEQTSVRTNVDSGKCRLRQVKAVATFTSPARCYASHPEGLFKFKQRFSI